MCPMVGGLSLMKEKFNITQNNAHFIGENVNN